MAIMKRFKLGGFVQKQLLLKKCCAVFRGRRLLRSRDGRCGFLERSGAVNVARAALKQDGPLGDGSLSSKPSPEKNGSSLHSEVKHILTLLFTALVASLSGIAAYRLIIRYRANHSSSSITTTRLSLFLHHISSCASKIIEKLVTF